METKKETPGETHNRLRSEISRQPNAGQDYIFKLCEAYHQERMKQLSISDKDVERLLEKLRYDDMLFSEFKKAILELITKDKTTE